MTRRVTLGNPCQQRRKARDDIVARAQKGKDDDKKGSGLFEWWRSSDEDNSKFGAKAAEKAYQNQLKILEARRDKKKGAQRAQQVKERRAKVSRKMRGIDKEEKPKAKSKKPLYDEPERSIPIPMASFGIPEFDGGERFDLKGPYVDEGYVDEDADIMGKIFGGLFRGKGKKNKGDKESGNNKNK